MTEETKEIAVRTGGAVSGLIPRSVEEFWRVAVAISKSGLAPTSMSTPEKCMVAVMAGAEVGLAPFQAVQSFAVINGRPVLWGDAMMAIVRSSGFVVEEWAEGEDEERIAHCRVIRPDNKQVIERSFSVAQAKRAGLWTKANTPWITYPERMLQMRARAYALRDAAADVLKGFSMREEVVDIEVVEPDAPRSSLRERLEANKEPKSEGFNIENPETPDELIAEIEPIGGERPTTTAQPDETRPTAQDPPAEAVTPASEPGMATGTPATGGDIAEGKPPELVEISDELETRINKYVDNLMAAQTLPRLLKLRELAADLRRTVAELNPEREDAMDAVFNRRYEELSEGKLL